MAAAYNLFIIETFSFYFSVDRSRRQGRAGVPSGTQRTTHDNIRIYNQKNGEPTQRIVHAGRSVVRRRNHQVVRGWWGGVRCGGMNAALGKVRIIIQA